MERLYLTGRRHIHFIGIGGSGMFPLAQILHDRGYYLTGSDNNESETLKLVKALGIPVMMGQAAKNIAGADLIVYSAAIMEDNPELMAAKASGVVTIGRSVLLGEITNRYKTSICVSGTHGKTTTSAMLTQIFLYAGADPSAIIGGKLKSIGSNGRAGKSGTVICEACEYRDTFLKLRPTTAVVLNIDRDHMEYFKTMDNLVMSFRKFIAGASERVIVNGDDPHYVELLEGNRLPFTTFGRTENCDYRPVDERRMAGMEQRFTMIRKGQILGAASIFIPGRHNILNAAAAIAAAMENGITFADCVGGLREFYGAGRRFEVLGTVNGVTFADDYAHHPTEISLTLKAAKELPYKRVIAVHQPFTYSRTKILLHEFARALQLADEVVLTPIMGSRERNLSGVKSEHLAALVARSVCCADFEETARVVAKMVREGDLVLTLGCGDVYKVVEMIWKEMKRR